jgi:DNA-directed RNA polymerase subunit RPC12/RpoP
MAASRKRLFEDLSEIQEGAAGQLHCAVQYISPVKKSQTGIGYYTGTVTDGNRTARIVGFDETTQKQLSSFQNSSIQLQNCNIKKSRSDELEIMIGRNTIIQKSPKKFDISFEKSVQNDEVESSTLEVKKIADLREIDIGTAVSVKARIAAVEPARAVSTGVVQDIVIADGTGSIRMSVWEINVDKIQLHGSYQFTNLYVRTYLDEKYLTLSRKSVYEVIADDLISAVYNEEVDCDDLLTNATIVGTQNFNVHYSCFNCSTKLPDETDDALIRCTKCKVLQSIRNRDCKVSCNVFFQTDTEVKLLKASTDIVQQIVGTEVDFFSKKVELLMLKEKRSCVSYSRNTSFVKTIQFNSQ